MTIALTKRYQPAEPLSLVSPSGDERTFKGYVANVEGAQLELFPVSALTHVLGIPYERVYKLERRGFPCALWRLPIDRRCSRYYSRKQLLVIAELHSRCRTKKRTNVSLLIAAVNKVFYVIDAPQGKTHVRST